MLTAYTRTLELAQRAGIRSDLPPRLRDRLRRIVPDRPALAQPLPPPPLPASLTARLRRIPHATTAPPPSLSSPLPAVAASALLVAALGLVLGNPYRAGAAVARELAGPTERALSELESRRATFVSVLARSSAQARAEARARRDELIGAGGRLLERARELPAALDPTPERVDDESTPKSAPSSQPRRKESNR